VVGEEEINKAKAAVEDVEGTGLVMRRKRYVLNV